MKKFALKLLFLTLLTLICFTTAFACQKPSGNDPSVNPPVAEDYFDNATDVDTVVANVIKVDGNIKENAWSTPLPYTATNGDVSITAKTLFYANSTVVGVKIENANTYFNTDAISNSALLKVKIGYPNNCNADGYRVLTVLMDGKTRLEEYSNGALTKVTDANKYAGVKVENGVVTVEFAFSNFATDWTTKSIMLSFAYNNPTDSSCQSSNVVEFTHDFYNQNVPFTWTAFNVSGYVQHKTFSDKVYYNPVNGLISESQNTLSYGGSKYVEFAVDTKTDDAKRISANFKADWSKDFLAGYKYGEYEIGIERKDSGDYYFVGGETDILLTLAQKQALYAGDMVLSATYSDGSIYLYTEVDGIPTKVIEKAVSSANDLKVFSYDTFAISNLKLADDTFKVISKVPTLGVTVNEFTYGGKLSITVTKGEDLNLLSLSVAGKPITLDGSLSYTVVIDNFSDMFAIIDGEADINNFDITLYAIAGASNPWPLLEDTKITLIKNGTEYTSTVGKNGVVRFENIVYGTYTIKCDFYGETSITLTKDNLQPSKTLVYDMFKEDGSNWVVSSDQTSFEVGNAGSQGLYFNEVHDQYMITVTAFSKIPIDKTPLEVSTAGLTEHITNTGLRIFNGDGASDYFTMKLLYWFNTNSTEPFWGIKTQGTISAIGDMPDSAYKDFNSVGLKLMFIKSGNTFSAYYMDGNGKYNFVEGVHSEFDIKKISFNYWDNPIVRFEDFAYQPIAPDLVVNKAVVESNDGLIHGQIEVSKTIVGEELVIKTFPDDGYKATAVIINGLNAIDSFSDNEIRIKNCLEVEYNIEVRFEKMSKISGKILANTPVGKDVFVEFVSKTTTDVFYTRVDSNGCYVLEDVLSEGAYKVYIYGLGEVSINITNDVLLLGKLDLDFEPIFTSIPTGWTQDGDGDYTYVKGANREGLVLKNNNTYGEMVVYNPIKGQGAFGSSSIPTKELGATVFQIITSKDTTTWGLVYNLNTGWALRFSGSTYKWHQFALNEKQLELFNTTGLRIAIFITNDYMYGLCDDGNGNLAIMVSGSITSKKECVESNRPIKISAIYTDFDCAKITGVIVKENYPVDLEVSTTLNGKIEKASASYGLVSAIITPNIGYGLKSVKLNDTDVTSFVKDGKLTYSYNSSEKVVLSVEFEKYFTLAGTLIGENGNNQFKVYKGTIVKLTNTKNTYQTKVGDDGKYEFVGVKQGSYTLSVGAVNKTIVVSSDKLDANYTILYTAAVDPYALTYRDQSVDDYNKDKYYSNLEVITVIADPAIIKITDERSEYFGEYFMYGTTDASKGFRTYKSKDLVNWEYVSYCFDCTGGWEHGDLWAPEVIYDANADRAKLGLGEGKGVYYFFYSSTAHYVDFYSGCTLGLGVSTSPAGPFVRYVGYDQLGRYIDRYTPWMHSKTVDAVMNKNYKVPGTHQIDPTPFIDPETGDYYLFMTAVKACKFVDKDWSQMDYNSFTLIVKGSHNMISQEAANQVGAKYESYNTRTNEGPQVTYHNGKYYLTISINGYQEKGYSVLTCVADDVLGPYRKLKPDEGGILVSAVYGDDNTAQYGSESNVIDNLSGPGHHFMWQEGDELFIVYHRHEYVQDAPGGDYYFPSTGWYHTRYVAIDRVEWVKNKDGLEVMRAVGPTSSIQPIDYVFGQTPYDNIASDAAITVSSGENVSALTDELLLVYEIDKDIIKEFTATKEVTITLSFDDYRIISGLLIYNSKYYDKLFKSIKKIEFDCIIGQKFTTAYIDNLKYFDDYYDPVKKVTYPGGASVADFDELLCKQITITIEVPAGQSAIGVGEITVLGVPN